MKAMTKQWLDMGLRPRAVTRDLEWGIPVPMKGDEWVGKCVYVWFEAVQGVLNLCPHMGRSQRIELPDGADMWKRWWNVSEEGPFHDISTSWGRTTSRFIP